MAIAHARARRPARPRITASGLGTAAWYLLLIPLALAILFPFI